MFCRAGEGMCMLVFNSDTKHIQRAFKDQALQEISPGLVFPVVLQPLHFSNITAANWACCNETARTVCWWWQKGSAPVAPVASSGPLETTGGVCTPGTSRAGSGLTHTAPPQHYKYSAQQNQAWEANKSDNFTIRRTDKDGGLLP